MKHVHDYKSYVNESLNPTSLTNASDIHDLFNHESGYDTPKKINRSSEIVPTELLNEIEQGITLETLNRIPYPIFKYRTQITIHGQFDELTTNRITNNSYKTIFQNQNKSIGIKWNAIDFDKKKLIYSVLKANGFGVTLNSSSYSASKILTYNKENVDLLKVEYDRIDDSLFIGTKRLYKCNIPMYGTFIVVDVIINAILKENVWKLLSGSFNITESEWLEQLAEKKRKSDLYMDELRKSNAEYEAEQEKSKMLEIKKLSKEYKVITFDEIPSSDCIMFYIDRYLNKILIKKYNKKGVVVFQSMKESSYEKGCTIDEINQRLSKYDNSEARLRNKIKNETLFLYKVFESENKENKKNDKRT